MPKISALPSATTVAATDKIVVVQGGTTKQANASLGVTYATTSAESAASPAITIVNPQYPPGNVLRYGATGDGVTDDTAAIQAAFNAAQNGQGVHFPGGVGTVYECASISVYGDTQITADEGVIIEKNGGAWTTHIFDCISTLGSATPLTASTAKRDTSVAVTSATGLSVGQVVLLRDTQYKWSTNCRNLEFNEIADISGLTITLKNRLIGAYLTGGSPDYTAELVPVTVPARRIRFENVRCRIPTGQDGGAFYFQEAYDCALVNCSSTGQKGQAGFQVWRSAYITVRGGDYSDGQAQSTAGYGYGGSFAQSSHHCVAHDVTFRNVRECAVSLGARFCGFVNCQSHSSYDNAFNSHADGSEDCFFINCRSYYARSKGFYAGGATSQAADKRIRFINCESNYSGYFGFWADGVSGIESEDIEFINCKAFHWGDDTATSYGIYAYRTKRPRIIGCSLDGDDETNARAGIKCELAVDAVVRGNIVRGVANGWGIIHANCTGIEIDDNSVTGMGGSSQGVYAESTASTKVCVRRNRSDNDTQFTKNAGDIHEFNEYSTKRDSPSGAAATIADGGTVTHGCVATPTWVMATGSITNEFVSVTAKSGTNFTVAIKKDDGTAGTTQTIYWRAGL